jgi:hypothetical protein
VTDGLTSFLLFVYHSGMSPVRVMCGINLKCFTFKKHDCAFIWNCQAIYVNAERRVIQTVRYPAVLPAKSVNHSIIYTLKTIKLRFMYSVFTNITSHSGNNISDNTVFPTVLLLIIPPFLDYFTMMFHCKISVL